jgi:hypothetical protein
MSGMARRTTAFRAKSRRHGVTASARKIPRLTIAEILVWADAHHVKGRDRRSWRNASRNASRQMSDVRNRCRRHVTTVRRTFPLQHAIVGTRSCAHHGACEHTPYGILAHVPVILWCVQARTLRDTPVSDAGLEHVDGATQVLPPRVGQQRHSGRVNPPSALAKPAADVLRPVRQCHPAEVARMQQKRPWRAGGYSYLSQVCERKMGDECSVRTVICGGRSRHR